MDKSSTAGRVPFLDTVRLLGVLAVVALHATVAYSPLAPWWYVTDPGKSAGTGIVLAVTDGFPIPLLFAVAGYFALSSLVRHGESGFLIGKLKRLGMPLVGLALFYTPIIAYVDFLDKGGSGTFFKHWLKLLPTVLDWSLQSFGTLESAAISRTLLWPYHLWFLAVLLVFCALTAACGLVVAGLAAQDGRKAGFGRSVLLLAGIALAEGLAQVAFSDPTWDRLGPFLAFQPSRLPLYLGFFLLGMYAWKREWFVRHQVPGPLWLWVLGVILAFGAMAATATGTMAPGPKSPVLPFAYGMARTGFGLAVTGLLAIVGQRWWSAPGRVARSLSSASYVIYLYHFPMVVVLQYMLAATSLPVFGKFAVAFLTPSAVCWAAAHLSGRFRLLMPCCVAATFGICLLVWG